MSEVHIIAVLYPKAGKGERLKQILAQFTEDVHAKESGALRYLMTEEVGTQKPNIIMLETYKDAKAQAEHAETEHFKALLDVIQKEDLEEKPMYLAKTMTKAGFDLDRQAVSREL